MTTIICKEVFSAKFVFLIVFLLKALGQVQGCSYSNQIHRMGQLYSWIQRKMMDEPEQYEFPKTLKEFGYAFNDAGQLRTIDGDNKFTFVVREGDHSYNQQHYDALGNAVTEEINSMMEEQYKLQKVYLPVNAEPEEAQSYTFISEDLHTNSDKLMVLIHGSGAVCAGQWSRRLIINDDLEKGSQLPYIKWAIENGYAVIVANTNLNFVDAKKKKPVPIRENSSPEEHVETVWREFVQRSPAKNIVIMAHSYGGICTASLCMNHLGEFKDKVFAIALTDSVHGLRQKQDDEIIDFFKERAMNWASAYDPLDAPLHSSRSQCPAVSAGTDVHELTSYTSMASIFKYINKKYDQKMNPEKYKQEHDAELKTETPSKDLIKLAEETPSSGNEAANNELTNQMKDVQITQDSSSSGSATANEKTADAKDSVNLDRLETEDPAKVEVVDEKKTDVTDVKSEL